MNFRHLIFTGGIGLLATCVHAQSWGVWQSEAPLPTNGVAKTHSVGLELDGMVYVLGGPPWMNPGSGEDGTVFSMPIGGSTWTEAIGFDGYGGVLGQGGGVDDLGRIIIFGGDDPLNPGFDRPPFEWNPLEGPWHEHAARSASAPQTNFAFCTDEANRIYSIGGGPGVGASAGSPNSSYVERYIGSADMWEPVAPMPMGVANAAASIDGLGHILVFGGINELGTGRTNAVMQYDIATNTWSASANASMPIAISDHQATLGADGRVYIMGGTVGSFENPSVVKSVYIYDPMNDQWSIGPDMAHPRRHFASFLGSDDRMYVIGGENLDGGAWDVESVYTTPCAVFVSQPQSQTIWEHSTLSLIADNSGGGTITYQWMFNGQPVVDGTDDLGALISGSQTNHLRIELMSGDLAGSYSLVATNSCGSVESDAAVVSVRATPTIPTQWTWTSLHPSYADHSYAAGVDGDTQVGWAVFDTPEYNGIDHPMRWQGTALSGVNLTPGDSQGGGVSDFAGDKLVGWWWEPIHCYVNHQWQTCYYRRGCWWDLNGTFHATNYSGFEYTSMNATDGTTIVGAGSTDDASGNVYTRGVIWQGTDQAFAYSLQPNGYTGSNLIAVDGEYQYGTVSLPYQGIHAGMWHGIGGEFVDLHPPSAINSMIADAADGQQVGVINQWHSPHAVIWSNSIDSLVDLNPAGASESQASGCDGGLQIGTVYYAGDPVARNGIWAGSASTFVDLSGIVPDGYTGFNMAAIDVAADGSISIVGNSWNTGLQRIEAILVTSGGSSACIADFTGDGLLNFFDVSAFLSAFSAGDPQADLNSDSSFDFFDVSAFLGAFAAGCP